MYYPLHPSSLNGVHLNSHVLPGMQEAAAEKFEQLFEVEAGENLEPNVSKMLAKKEDLAGTPYRTRTCDPLIKSHGVLV